MFQPSEKMTPESDELFFMLHAERIALLCRISRIILRLRNRAHRTIIHDMYLQFFELGHKILLRQIARWYQAYSTTQGNDIYIYF